MINTWQYNQVAFLIELDIEYMTIVDRRIFSFQRY